MTAYHHEAITPLARDERATDAGAFGVGAAGSGLNLDKSVQIPIIRSDVFKKETSARFALGVVANQGEIIPGYEEEFYGAAMLRGRVYLDKNFVTLDDLDENMAEKPDYDDDRSVHFVILEQMAVTKSLARVVGNIRLIVKGEDGEPLPVERFYADQFGKNPAPAHSTEVSRLICRHEDGTVQNALKWPLFMAGVEYVEQNDLGPVYGLLDPKLANSLIMQQVPVEPLAEAKFIPEIMAAKQPVEIDVPRLSKIMGSIGSKQVVPKEGGFSFLSLGTGTTHPA